MQLVGDFETTTNINDCRVWGSCLVNIDNLEVIQLVNNIDDTMLLLENLTINDKVELYYHNLKFDGEFILSWLYNNGFTYDEGLSSMKTFRALITDTGIFYQIEVRFHRNKNRKKLIIRDSLKIIPLRVEQFPKAFGLEVTKGEIDYTKHRELNHELTEEEIDYIKRDCLIVAQGLKFMFEQGLNKMTISSCALNNFKETLGGNNKFRALFPVLDVKDDKFIRESYKGGYTYVNPKFQNKWLKQEGCTYDVNSLYPSQMHSSSGNLLPFGMPVYFKGEYPKNDYYPLYIIRFKCKFKLKKGYVPTIQIKNNIRFCGKETEYLTNSGVERVELTMTNIDFETMLKHYNVTRLEFLDGYMFKGKIGIFDKYINHWNRIKEKATQEKNEGMRTIAKLMNNSLYGKFATNPINDTKIPVMLDGVVKHESKLILENKIEDLKDIILKASKDREVTYTAMACFITAYARRVTHRAIQDNYDNFCYADTDSIHILGNNVLNIDIDDSDLGAWKHECNWTDAKFIRAKTYIEEIKGNIVDGKFKPSLNEWTVTELDVKCAGMPDNVKKVITKDNFKIGFSTEKYGDEYQKIVPKRVRGGVVLVNTTFSIK